MNQARPEFYFLLEWSVSLYCAAEMVLNVIVLVAVLFILPLYYSRSFQAAKTPKN
jgi:hypothetical protein